MTLRYIQGGEIWRGEPVAGVSHPRNIEALWSAEDLAGLGLESVPPPEPEPAQPRGVPRAVPMWKAKVALANAGLLDTVDALIASEPQAVRIAWDYSAELTRGSATLAALAGKLGLSEAAVDELFRHAALVTL